MESTHDQAAMCRAKPMHVDDGLECIRWIRRLGGGRLPAASYIRSSPKYEKKKVYFWPSERDRDFSVVCFLHTSGQMLLCQTPDRRPPRITGRVVNTVTRGWVGAPNERAPSRFHDVAVGFIDRCLSRARNFAASN